MALLGVQGANLVAVESVAAVEAILAVCGSAYLIDCGDDLVEALRCHGIKVEQVSSVEYRIVV